MKNLILIISALIIGYSLNAQSTFEKVITKGTNENSKSVIQTSDGGYAFLGNVGSGSGYDRWLVKTNQMGDTLWTRIYHGIGNTRSGDRCIIQTSDGGFTFIANRNGKTNLLHTSSTGDSLWEKELYAGTGIAISPAVTNGYIVTGQGASSTWALKVCQANSIGNVIWQKDYFPIPLTLAAWPYSWAVREITGGGFIVAGGISTAFFTSVPFLFRIGPTGDSLWFKDYSYYGDEAIYSVELTNDNGFFACGDVNTGQNAYVMKFNSTGDTLWTRVLLAPGEQYFNSIRATDDGGVIACGEYASSFPNDSSKVYLVKFTSSGVIAWERKIGDYEYSLGASIEHTADTGFIICGDVKQTITSSQHALLIKTDGNGNMTGIENHIAEANTWFYPNPASDYTNLSLPANHPGLPIKIKLYNLFGQQVKIFETPVGQTNYPLKIIDLPPGIYAATIETPNKPVERAKLVVRR